MNEATVFVVDDDRGLLRLVEKSLRRENFSVAAADSGETAFAWLNEHRPDLMLLDLKLVDTDAKELIAKLSAAKKLGPFLIIT